MKYVDPRNPWFVVLILSLAIFACSLPALITSPSPAAPTSTHLPVEQALPSEPSLTRSPAITYQPTFVPAPCAFPVPRGYSPECGYLIVPENRAQLDSQQIRLYVGIFRNRAGTPNPEGPVLKISGGPGSSGLNTAGYLLDKGMGALLEQRDFIVFDQRGTGYSRPRLDCPERISITAAILGGRLTAEESAKAIIDSFQRCRDRLIAEGIDLSAYNSVASAADINDLRTVLGYEQLNLYAISYGTRLALTFMRDYPNTVRSAVLDSAYPLDVNLYTTLAPNAERAFNVFFDHCAADPGCNNSYPELRTVFYGLVDELNVHPVFVPLFIDNGKVNVRLDGGLLIDVLFGGLYSPAASATMPQMIYEVREGDYNVVSQRLERYFETSSALGMQMAVQCSEEFPFSTLQEAYAAAQNVQPQIAAYYPESVQPLFAVCREWTLPPPDPRENLPVSSDVPALVLAGEGDPITPPEWGRRVAGDLSHAYFHEFPGNGHWVARSSNCAVQMALAFWEDPTVDPGSMCP
ncbi:MAG TPA: alpha/beta fold hydrolase [Anaerolineales bacterium]|nr:alpha/beta fold hydrolase [Anaerolineales bacterium]